MTIWFLQGGSKRTRPSIIRANLRIWSKIRVFLEFSKIVSTYVEKNKKILKKSALVKKLLRIWLIFHSSTGISRRSRMDTHPKGSPQNSEILDARESALTD